MHCKPAGGGSAGLRAHGHRKDVRPSHAPAARFSAAVSSAVLAASSGSAAAGLLALPCI
ncbi:hypothetical protein STEG23_016346, partial [Scotinomys teguina]